MTAASIASCSLSHRLGDDYAHLLGRLYKVGIVEMGVLRCGSVPTMAEQLADQRQVLTGHDGLAGGGMSKVMQAKPAERRILTNRAP